MDLPRSLALLLLFLSPSVRAEDPPAPPPAGGTPAASSPGKPPGPTLDERLAAVKKQMKQEKWQAALAGIRGVFEEFKDSGEVVGRLPAIEEDLKLCTYKAQAKPPTPEETFGPGTKSFTAKTRLLTMEFPRGPVSPPWEETSGSTARLPIQFNDVTVDYEGGLEGRLAASIAFDFSAESGYDLRAGGSNGNSREQASIARLEGAPGAVARRAVGLATKDNDAGPGKHRVRFSRKGKELSIQVDGRVLVSVQDATFPRGLLGLRGAEGGSVTVRGTVDADHLRARVEECEQRRYEEWAAKSWKREEAIPAWARQEEK